jgi:aerobic-type carbon monoxide dehydrogenase small subunit (CoxS/CutS family)
MPVSFFVNGAPVVVDIAPATPLLDGETVRSCITPVSKAEGRHLFIVEGQITCHLPGKTGLIPLATNPVMCQNKF